MRSSDTVRANRSVAKETASWPAFAAEGARSGSAVISAIVGVVFIAAVLIVVMTKNRARRYDRPDQS
ncbi:hypothetical protein RKD28_000244 [Streptomyces sp. SAI-229]|jgi:hypothetical protein